MMKLAVASGLQHALLLSSALCVCSTSARRRLLEALPMIDLGPSTFLSLHLLLYSTTLLLAPALRLQHKRACRRLLKHLPMVEACCCFWPEIRTAPCVCLVCLQRKCACRLLLPMNQACKTPISSTTILLASALHLPCVCLAPAAQACMSAAAEAPAHDRSGGGGGGQPAHTQHQDPVQVLSSECAVASRAAAAWHRSNASTLQQQHFCAIVSSIT
jgi:hypothetical protein